MQRTNKELIGITTTIPVETVFATELRVNVLTFEDAQYAGLQAAQAL